MAHFIEKNRVLFHQTDLAGIVHFSEFFRYFESAEHAMFRDLGFSVHRAENDLGWPRIACSFDYLAPLYFEDEFYVAITIEHIGSTSLGLSCEVQRLDKTLVAKGKTTSVCCRRNEGGQMVKTPIPDDIRSKLESLMTNT